MILRAILRAALGMSVKCGNISQSNGQNIPGVEGLVSLWCVLKVKMLVTQSCPTLCNPMDRSPPGPSVHRILQARMLEWIAIPFSRGSSQHTD